MTVEKVVDGDTTNPGAAGPFIVAMTCTLDDETGSRTVSAGDLVLGGDGVLTETVSDLPTGAVCRFQETDSQNAASVTIEPVDGVVVGDGTVATLTVTNTFDPPPQPPLPPLPNTGAPTGVLLRTALLMLLAGGAIFLTSRRRRTT